MALWVAEVTEVAGNIGRAIAQKPAIDRDFAVACNAATLLSSASRGIGLTTGKRELSRNFSQSENYQGRSNAIDTFSR